MREEKAIFVLCVYTEQTVLLCTQAGMVKMYLRVYASNPLLSFTCSLCSHIYKRTHTETVTAAAVAAMFEIDVTEGEKGTFHIELIERWNIIFKTTCNMNKFSILVINAFLRQFR